MSQFKNIEWCNDHVRLLDQTLLPNREIYLEIKTAEQMAEAIKMLRIRGAPAIGVAAAYGLALGAKRIEATNGTSFIQGLNRICDLLIATRPTAVNLKWAVQRLLKVVENMKEFQPEKIRQSIEQEAINIQNEDKELCKQIGIFGLDLFSKKSISILTHCNAGALATGGQGTALSIIYELKKKGHNVHVFADETRPLLQGARLTAWELQKSDIPATLICDNMAASVMQHGKIDCVIVGADRIAANGDVANKVGTLGVSLSAAQFGIPFYVAAPYSTFDLTLSSGNQIPIEERNPEEITEIGNQSFAPREIDVYNPAFDVTPNKLISAIITDKGILYPPFKANVKKQKINP